MELLISPGLYRMPSANMEEGTLQKVNYKNTESVFTWNKQERHQSTIYSSEVNELTGYMLDGQGSYPSAGIWIFLFTSLPN
jgi:hypothetical protein